MSIRLRLALWCAGLCFVILLIVEVLVYTLHVRGHYDDLDRALVTSADHASAEVAVAAHLSRSPSLDIVLRHYRIDGTIEDSSPGADLLPNLDPRRLLDQPSIPAYDPLAGLAPSFAGLPPGASHGVFGLLTAGGERWRIYVLPVQVNGALVAYIVSMTSLGRLDASIQTFRILLVLIGLTGAASALAGGRAIAGQALHPVDRMVQTAETITDSHDLSRRLPVPPYRDELAHLATTFNRMLASIEQAYRSEQRFVADASHELRTPLTVIQGNLELLRRQTGMTEADRADLIVETEREANRLTRLVADLLALARADAGVSLQQRPVDLDALVLQVFHEMRALARNQTITLEAFEPVQVDGDADRLKQLLVIVLDNAIKYTPAGGKISLGLRRIGTQAEISVRDTGVGIPAEAVPHIFERFYRADPARARDPGGTGLGLPIARWIAEQHDGQIEATSEPGTGTTVTIHLPTINPY